VDQSVLKQLGALGRTGGAGTSSAAAALFLASRYAAEPKSAITHVARFPAVDTDTLASMVGGILGALYGSEWLTAESALLQDHAYIGRLAEELVHGNGGLSVGSVAPVARRDLDDALQSLQQASVRSVWRSPDGRDGQVTDRRELKGITPNASAISWRIRLHDGQSISINRATRVIKKVAPPTGSPQSEHRGQGSLFNESPTTPRSTGAEPPETAWRKRPTPEDAYEQVARLSFDPATIGRYLLEFSRRGADGYGVAMSFASLVARAYRARQSALQGQASEEGIKRDIRRTIEPYFQDIPLRKAEHQAMVELLFLAGVSPAAHIALDVRPTNGDPGHGWELSLDPLKAYKVISDGTQGTLSLIKNTLEHELVPTVRSWKAWHELRPEPTGR
jgi:hypothetical protein